MPKPRLKSGIKSKYSKAVMRVDTVYYPWKTMNVGDEFTLRGSPTRTNGSAASQAFAAGHRYGRKFSVRKTVKGNWIITRVA